MAKVEPFHIYVPDSKLYQLNQKLSLTIIPDEVDNSTWDYGTPRGEVERLANYWKNTFSWRKVEERINMLPNYSTIIDVDGFEPLSIHFVHVKSHIENAIPLLFLHGWPGSFLEMAKLLPLLADVPRNGGPAFHIVAPSLPNFGFSSGVKQRDFGLAQYADTCHKLMLMLGYNQFVGVGGDWGSTIIRNIALRYPRSLKAIYLSFIPTSAPSARSPLAFASFVISHFLNLLPQTEKSGLVRTLQFQKTGMGYYHLQSTKPQTIGYLLADSPVGLLAWMYEKLHDWSDGYNWTDEEVCTWASLYWFSAAGPAASVRIYYECIRGEFIAGAGGYLPGVKLGLAYFPKEILLLPKAWGRSLGEIVYEVEHDSGGHFAAWEKPEYVVGDLRCMFSKGGGAFGVLDRRNGYASD